MKDFTKKEAEVEIINFFEKNSIEAKEVKKIKKLAMSHRIKLKEYRKRFCKKCCSDLKLGIVRLNNLCKQVTCKKCNALNREVLKN